RRQHVREPAARGGGAPARAHAVGRGREERAARPPARVPPPPRRPRAPRAATRPPAPRPPAALRRLQDVARSGANVFAELMETVKVASLEQITQALFEVGGSYRRSSEFAPRYRGFA